MEDELERVKCDFEKAIEQREAWKQKFARLQNLMDAREIQPNKPCCLAARADEREACAKVCAEQLIWLKKFRGEK